VASEAELSSLEAAPSSGACLAPLIQEGDILYIDHRCPAQFGDLVVFAASSRFAAAQNEGGARADSSRAWPPLQAGDRWAKLFTPVHGMGMLMDNRGEHGLVSFMAGESADATPRLAPIRNIRRNGVLLFNPEVCAGNIAPGAATSVFLASLNSPNAFGYSRPLASGHVPDYLLTIASPPFDCTVIVTLTIRPYILAGGASNSIAIEVMYADDAAAYPGTLQFGTVQIPMLTTPENIMLQCQFSHSHAFATSYAGLAFYDTASSGFVTIQADYYSCQAEYIKL
jgi:hypothetical protein